MLHASLND